MKKISIILAFLFLGFGIIYSQELEDLKHVDVVYLNDGSEFRGKIKEYLPNDKVVIEILGGNVLTFSSTEVKKVVQELINVKGEKVYNFKEKGIYNFLSLDFSGGRNDWNNFDVGIGLHNVTGYQFNRWIGVGLGAGIDAFEPSSARLVVPVYAEARGYLLERIHSPFYSLGLGLGMPLKTPASDIIGGKPGPMFYPSIGYRIGSNKDALFTLDLGFKLQKVTYEIQEWDSIRTEFMRYQRFTLRFGILFG